MVHFVLRCPAPDKSGNLTGSNGRACFWFSNGCTVFCDECDGDTRGPIPDEPSVRHKMNVCNTTMKASVCDKKFRTVNTEAECGAEDVTNF